MPDFATIKGRVEEYVMDLPQATSALIGDWVNKALRDFQDHHNFRCMEASFALTTTAGTRTLGAKPNDWKESRANPWLHRGSHGAQTIEWAVSQHQMHYLFSEDDPNDKGAPAFILEGVSDVSVYPYPDGSSQWGDGEYRVNIPYWAYFPALAADTATNWFTENLDWGLVFFAAAEGMDFNREEKRAQYYRQRASQEFTRVQRQDARSRTRRANTLVPLKGVHGMPRGRRRYTGRRNL